MRTPLFAIAVALTVSPVAFAQSAYAGDGKMKSHGSSAMKSEMPAMVSESASLGDLTISAGFARATLPNQPVAGGFMTIVNAGDRDDRLIAVSSPSANRMEIHEMKMDGDVMRMREMADGLAIPAGETVTLEPGGYHIMFMELEGPFVEGETKDVTLVFEQAGEVSMTLPVNARGMRKGHGGHGKHGKGS